MPLEFLATAKLDWLKTAFFEDKDKKRWLSKWRAQLEKPSDLWKNSWKKGREEKKGLAILPDPDNLSTAITLLPPLSFMLHIPFSLQKPYLSKDERAFHLLDNPVRKEKVFQTPMVASTSWKGALRAAMWQLGHDENCEITIRMFGNPRENDEQQAGRLYFYPTFFDKVCLEVINPHDRKTGIGTVPILMECVPQGTKGNLYVLYVPFGSVAQSEAAQDLEVLAEGIKAMLTVYGFGAKTSSGFGMADLQGKGQLVVHYPDESKRPPKPIRPAEPDAVRAFREKYPKYADEDFALGTKDWKEKHSATNSERKAYRDAKAEWQNYTKQLETYQQQQKEWEEAQKAPLPPISASFGNWDKLGEQATRVAAQLRGGEG